jgi:hypothetical protein
MGRWIGTAGYVALGALAVVSACGGSEGEARSDTSGSESHATETAGTDEGTDTTTTTAPPEPATPQGAIGETVAFAGGGHTQCCSLTVHGLTDPYPTSELSPVYHPDPDERVVAVDVEIANLTSGDTIPVSLADLTVRDTADGFYSFSTMLGGGSLENGVSPGQSFRATLLYNVDATASGLRFEFAPMATGAVAVVTLS